MGYYTDFEITAVDESGEQVYTSIYKEKLEELSGYPFYESGEYDLYRDEIKWYNSNETMTELSKKFPTYLFKVDGKGEEDGDIWKAYFKNGKSKLLQAKVTVTFSEFDPAELN